MRTTHSFNKLSLGGGSLGGGSLGGGSLGVLSLGVLSLGVLSLGVLSLGGLMGCGDRGLGGYHWRGEDPSIKNKPQAHPLTDQKTSKSTHQVILSNTTSISGLEYEVYDRLKMGPCDPIHSLKLKRFKHATPLGSHQAARGTFSKIQGLIIEIEYLNEQGELLKLTLKTPVIERTVPHQFAPHIQERAWRDVTVKLTDQLSSYCLHTKG